MQTFDKNQADRSTQLLVQREAELRAALRSNEDRPDQIGEPDSKEVSDFKGGSQEKLEGNGGPCN